MKLLNTVVLPLFFALMGLMSVTVDAKIFADIKIGNNKYKGALVDTGADITIIPRELVSHGMLIQQTRVGRFTVADGRSIKASIYSARVSMGDLPPAIIEVAVLPGARMLIGINALEAFGATIHLPSRTVRFQGSAYQPTHHTKNELPHSPSQVFKPYIDRRYLGEVHPGC